MNDRTYYWFDKRLPLTEGALLTICPGCATSFEPRRANQSFCTRSCQNATYMRQIRQRRDPMPTRTDLIRAAFTELVGL